MIRTNAKAPPGRNTEPASQRSLADKCCNSPRSLVAFSALSAVAACAAWIGRTVQVTVAASRRQREHVSIAKKPSGASAEIPAP